MSSPDTMTPSTIHTSTSKLSNPPIHTEETPPGTARDPDTRRAHSPSRLGDFVSILAVYVFRILRSELGEKPTRVALSCYSLWVALRAVFALLQQRSTDEQPARCARGHAQTSSLTSLQSSYATRCGTDLRRVPHRFSLSIVPAGYAIAWASSSTLLFGTAKLAKNPSTVYSSCYTPASAARAVSARPRWE
jgi:hypothetical protein